MPNIHVGTILGPQFSTSIQKHIPSPNNFRPNVTIWPFLLSTAGKPFAQNRKWLDFNFLAKHVHLASTENLCLDEEIPASTTSNWLKIIPISLISQFPLLEESTRSTLFDRSCTILLLAPCLKSWNLAGNTRAIFVNSDVSNSPEAGAGGIKQGM